jgi:hypothetical protein
LRDKEGEVRGDENNIFAAKVQITLSALSGQENGYYSFNGLKRNR